ncbi:hypothetical protein ON010_g9480 [Phytophthora cinnamomi]|nr:hypothetical protein ON010_g9480 [Phytophthora cinnamomi]
MSVAAELPSVYVTLRSPNKKTLQNVYGSHRAACTSNRRDMFVSMQLLRSDGQVKIRSTRSGHTLAVRPSGECYFDGGGCSSGEAFIPETARGGWITFVSSKTRKYLAVDEWGDYTGLWYTGVLVVGHDVDHPETDSGLLFAESTHIPTRKPSEQNPDTTSLIYRLRQMKPYAENSNRFRVLLSCILTPLPCVALATLVESAPLAPPNTGPYKNYVFWIRAWIVTGFVDYSMVMQMSQSLAQLKMQHSYIVAIALVGSIISFFMVFAVAVWVTFPVPFSMLVASPPSILIFLVGFGYMWGRRWWSDAGIRRDKRQCEHSSYSARPTELLSAIRVESKRRGASKWMIPQISKIFPTSLLQQRISKAGTISLGPAAELKSNRSFQRLEAIFSRQERAEFISTTTRVLYITEYLVHVEYTEAVLPVVYGIVVLGDSIPLAKWDLQPVIRQPLNAGTFRECRLSIGLQHARAGIIDPSDDGAQAYFKIFVCAPAWVYFGDTGDNDPVQVDVVVRIRHASSSRARRYEVVNLQCRDLPAGIPSRPADRAAGVKKQSGLNVERFIAREEELHQARKYAHFNETNANRAVWEEKQNRQTGSGARIQQNKRHARLQKYYDTCYQKWEQELRARGLALVRDRD